MKRYELLLIVVLIFVNSCTSSETDVLTPTQTPLLTKNYTTSPTPFTPPVPTVTATAEIKFIPLTTNFISIVFVEEGHIKVWQEETNDSQIIFDSGDVVGVSLSHDGQVIAFLRYWPLHWPHEADNPTSPIQYALWAINRDGTNPRELVSAELLRQADQADNQFAHMISEIAWLPNTHTIAYSTFAFPTIVGASYGGTLGDLQLVDIDTTVRTTIVPPGQDGRFIFSPNGQQIAIITADSLSFVNTDGSNWRQDILSFTRLTYPHEAYYPDGRWVSDTTFVMAAAIDEYTYNDTDGKFATWRVSADSSLVEEVAIINGRPDTVVFAPDGSQMSFVGSSNYRKTTLAAIDNSWSIVLDRDDKVTWTSNGQPFYIPAGESALTPICPDTALETRDDCGDPFSLVAGLQAASAHWINDTHFLFVTDKYPQALYLGSLDGNHVHIGTLTAYDGPSPRVYRQTFKSFAYHY